MSRHLAKVMTDIEKNDTKALYSCDILNSENLDCGRFTPKMLHIVYTVHGEAEITQGNEKHHLAPRSFIIIVPHPTIQVASVSPDFKAYHLGFAMELHASDVSSIDPGFYEFILKTRVWKLTLSQDRGMNGFCQSYYYICDELDSIMRSDLVSSLFSLFLRALYENTKMEYISQAKTSNINSRNITMRFHTLLRKNFRREHSVSFYADELCISAKYLTHIIKVTTGSTPKAIIDRMVAAESLYKLGKTSNTVQETSIELGFPDQSYFGRFFKRMFGISPAAYRQNPNLDLMKKLDERMDKNKR